MSTKDTSEPVFPQGTISRSNGRLAEFCGMSVRDYFAAHAMQGFVACPDCNMGADKIAEAAYALAEAMLRARQQ